MIGRAGSADSSLAMLDPTADGAAIADYAEDVRVRAGATTQPARRALDRAFSCQDYHFGYTACANCHSDQAFYVHHADLVQGYTFRCRICRHELTISAER
jgi:hypothetical protein